MSKPNESATKMQAAEESQNDKVDSEANGFRRSNSESEIKSSEVSEPSESKAEIKATEETQRNVIKSQASAASQVSPHKGNKKEWFSAEDNSRSAISGRSKKTSWKRSGAILPIPGSTKLYSLSIISEEDEFTPTQLPRYGARKNNEGKFDRNGSKSYFRLGTPLPDNAGTQCNDRKIEGPITKKSNSNIVEDYTNSRDSVRGNTATAKVEEEAQTDNVAPCQKGFISKSSDFPTITSRYFMPRKQRKNYYARPEEDTDIMKSQKENNDSVSTQKNSTFDSTSSVTTNTSDLTLQGNNNSHLTSSQESSTSDLTASIISSTSDLASSQNFDLPDNTHDTKNISKMNGAIKKSKIIINIEPAQRNYNFRKVEDDKTEDTDSVSSVNTVLLTEDPSNISDQTVKVFSEETQISKYENDSKDDVSSTVPLMYEGATSEIYSSVPDEEQNVERSVNSFSTGPLMNGASNSEIFSSASSARNLDEEMSSSQSCYGNRISHFTLELHNRLRYMKNVIAAQAFKKLPECNVDLPVEIRRTNGRRARIQVDKESLNRRTNSMSTFNRVQKQQQPEQGFFQSIPTDPRHNVTVALPRTHNGVATIERMEDILEMLLTIGYKISKEVSDGFGNQQVPTAIHNAMCDVKIFLEPLKGHIETSVQDEYMRPLLDSVQDTINPIFHHLNDSVVALESPATPFNYLPLKLVSRASWEEQSQTMSDEPEIVPLNAVEEIYEIGTYDRSIIDQAMHTFDHSTRFRAPFHRPGNNRAHVVPLGLIEIPFLQDIMVIVTLDLGIAVINKTEKIIAAISADGYWAGLRFAYGECLQAGSAVDASFFNKYGELTKRAKITEKGVTFQDERSPCTYLITNASITTCQALNSNLNHDFLGRILYSGSRYGPQYIPDCVELLNSSKGIYDDDGTITWIMRNLKVKQTPDGQIIIHKNSAEYTIIMTPNRQEGPNDRIHTTRLSTPDVHITCSMSARQKAYKHHMYIRQDPMKIFSSDQKFVVRNCTQSAGIDKDHKIYLNAS